MMFNQGDRVVDIHGNEATVIGVHTYVQVSWDSLNGINGMWPANGFKPVPAPFKPGESVRINIPGHVLHGIPGLLYEVDEEGLWVAVFDDDQTDAPFLEEQLAPWVPKVGERVVEKGEGLEEEFGTVIGWANAITARVLWDDYPHAQDFLICDLEPADEFEDEFSEGDEVEYHNPLFSTPFRGTAIRVGDETSFIKFPPGGLPDGFYDNDFISKAA